MKLPKLFSRRSQQELPGTVERAATINHTSETVGWRPVNYTIPERFRVFQNLLDQNIAFYIATAHPDVYNAHYYDEVIQSELALALAELAAKRAEHMQSIHNLRIYQNADLENMKLRLAQLERILAQNEEELA